MAHSVVEFLHAENHDFRTNGESRVLDCLGSSASVILDVGANSGEWALEASKRCPRAEIYCFELASATRKKLMQNVATVPRIKVLGFGLSDAAGSQPVKYYPERDVLTSFYDYPHSEPYVWTEERVQTGDSFLREYGLTHVDLLKIDTEGADFRVLKGFEETLSKQAVSVVQFEYGFACILARALLIDFYELFEHKGYRVGKLHKTGVDFRKYRLKDENFFGPNFVAVHRDNRTLLATLKATRN
jgi:FkbM family methyltransferase